MEYRMPKSNGAPGKGNRFARQFRMMKLSALVILGLAALVGFGIFVWVFCRIEPGNDQIAILIRKIGDNLGPNEIIATKPGQKGIQLETLAEGRHFRNPLFWDWEYAKVTVIPSDKVGVLTRLYGETLSPDKIIAPEGYKGIAEEVLTNGKYRINPYAYKVEIVDVIKIDSKEMGVRIYLDGKDPLNSDLPEELKNVYTVPEGVKGVQATTFPLGTYPLNPYMYSMIKMPIRDQSFPLKNEEAITFLTQDGFQISVEGDLRYAINPDMAALLTHRVGDIDDILKKIILPKARGFSRIEGSKHPAINFIVGETRQEFQNSLEKHLVAQCARWGVQVKSMVISNVNPPEEVAAIIRERELALQNQRKIDQQIEQARSQAELLRQEMLADQNREKVEAETVAIRALIQAEQGQSVKLTESRQKLDVARIEAEAAKLQAEATLIKAEAERSVVAMQNEAESSVTGAMAEAFGGGHNLARYTLYKKTAPMIGSILASDRESGLGSIFNQFTPGPGEPAGRGNPE